MALLEMCFCWIRTVRNLGGVEPVQGKTEQRTAAAGTEMHRHGLTITQIYYCIVGSVAQTTVVLIKGL